MQSLMSESWPILSKMTKTLILIKQPTSPPPNISRQREEHCNKLHLLSFTRDTMFIHEVHILAITLMSYSVAVMCDCTSDP